MKQLAVLTTFALGSGFFWGCGSPETQPGSLTADSAWNGARAALGMKISALPAWETAQEKELSALLPQQRATRATPPPVGLIQVPAEYSRMDGVLVRIPVGASDDDLNQQQLAPFYSRMVKGFINSGVLPYVLVADAEEEQILVDEVLSPNGISSGDVQFLRAPNNSLWARDYGPWHVYVDGGRAIVDQRYYSSRTSDDRIPLVLGKAWAETVYSTALYTEGGNFMTDGLGTCWASQGVLRNNSLSRVKIEAIYRDYLGCAGIHFVPPLVGEGTTHIDMFSKILNQDTILVGYSSEALGATDREIESLERAAAFYGDTPKPGGGQWNILRIPMTFHSLTYDDGSEERVYNAHTNSLIVNDHVLVPTYARGTDSAALALYRKAMPGYTVVGVDSREIIPFGGSVHCATMQIPAHDQAACGDGVVSGSEECEPRYLEGQTCQTRGYASGTLRCQASCRFDTSSCR